MTMFDTFDGGPFVYDDYTSNAPNFKFIAKKMYNRGPIMSKEERDTLHKWANELLLNNHMDKIPNGRFQRKITNNSAEAENATEPHIDIPLFFEIHKRIEEREHLTSNIREGYLKDFVTIIPKDAFIHKHTDPNDLRNNLFHVRFNVFISVPENGMNTYYDGHLVETTECCYALCRSGIDEHWSDVNKSDIPRISLSFGYLLPAEKIDELTNDATIGHYTSMYPLVKQDPRYLSLLNNQTNASDFDIEERGEKGSGIYTAENVLTHHQCDFITKYIIDNSSLWNETAIQNGNNVECKFITLSDMKKLNVQYSDMIDECIFSVVGRLLVKLNRLRTEFKGTQDDGYTLRKIYGGTKLHADGIHSKTSGFKNFVRCLSLIIVLNDEYDGGVFCFPNQGLKFRVQKGQAILFPPYWTHPHSVTSVGEGQSRYTINTWILEKFIDS